MADFEVSCKEPWREKGRRGVGHEHDSQQAEVTLTHVFQRQKGNEAMKKMAVVISLNALLGIFAAKGAISVTGDKSLFGIVGGTVLACVCSFAAGCLSNWEKRRACAKVRNEIYDSVVDAGSQMLVNGKAWIKGCRVDPETSSVIYPS